VAKLARNEWGWTSEDDKGMLSGLVYRFASLLVYRFTGPSWSNEGQLK